MDDESENVSAATDSTPATGIGTEEAAVSNDASVADETLVATPRVARTFPSLQLFTSIVVVGGAMLFLLATVHPGLLFKNNTPTGGDMGAHVWGPAFLRDHLLNNFRLTGWSMDWYSGFPMYRFYMVVPALFIVLLDVVLPYGIAFKLVAVAGIIALPFCAWMFGRLARFVYPLPEMFAIAATVFLYDESFTIYGGNIASTMAGEFSFSIALAFAVIGLGFLAHSLETGQRRSTAAVLISLAALCHGIVLIFVFGGAVVMLLLHAGRRRLVFGAATIGAAVLLAAFWVVPFLTAHKYMTDMKYEPRPSGATDSFWDMYFPLTAFWDIALMTFALIGFAASLLRRKVVGVWLGLTMIVLFVGVYVTRDSLPVIGLLWNPRLLPFLYLCRYMLAMVGIWAVATAGFRLIIADRGIAPESPTSITAYSVLRNATVWVVAVGVLCIVGFRFQQLPGGSIITKADGTSQYAWGPFRAKSDNKAFVDGWARWNFEGYEGKGSYAEYHDIVETMKQLGEDKSHGCGRALWENNGDLNKYGTTMALMLLPFWTNGCIGSQEGLFFEAAGTTPYHFISAAAMSKQSSNPVRELRYDNNDATKGVHYLQELGVKYYMAFTTEAIDKAAQVADLTEVARSGPWVVYEVAGSDWVAPMKTRPVVVSERSGDQRERWLELGTSWFQHPEEWLATPVDNGPKDWQHIDVQVDLTRRVGQPGDSSRSVDIVTPVQKINPVTLPAVNVTNVSHSESSISFTVDKVGVPVLVRVSFFPNWKVDGAKGPYRAAPNMMVVIPTDKNVRLHYSSSGIDKLAYLLTIIGIVIVVYWWRRGPYSL
jgi:6-pyruvoyl-tetrahydropterin synthase related domain